MQFLRIYSFYLLNVKGIGINHNFFQLGGDSVTAIKMEIEMEKRGIESKDTIESSIYKYPTIRQLLLMRKDIEYITV
ncbi:phosphopantetheine-binding protein [Clostridium estertheticum]|uniref:phosphopantetheine-binding protein n=1 Tax=Clostridium estertheticum TaxID=238834 RepID=UPI001C0DE980|nr:phosphopantetheine-binding protein [Clostridium estertheticum]MBU3198549.1 hypothetical protein [Clostridium estertheticum]WAG64529.1 phosphopantetheine-binding protein [Clostridium estertheticum]